MVKEVISNEAVHLSTSFLYSSGGRTHFLLVKCNLEDGRTFYILLFETSYNFSAVIWIGQVMHRVKYVYILDKTEIGQGFSYFCTIQYNAFTLPVVQNYHFFQPSRTFCCANGESFTSFDFRTFLWYSRK